MNTGIPKLLVVEDDPRDLALIEHALSSFNLGLSVSFVRDGAEALDFLRGTGAYAHRDPEVRPCVILLDLKIPKIDGLDLIRRVRSDADLALIPIVVFSSSQEHRDIAASCQLGANSYLVKPIQSLLFTEVLGTAIQYWLFLNKTPE